MTTPYGDIQGKILVMRFSTADFSIASVLTAIREHLDKLEEMSVTFLGAETEVLSEPTPVFRPVDVVARFEYAGTGNPQPVLERAYATVWHAVVVTFPDEAEWAAAKGDYAAYISSQADLLRARLESIRE